MASELRELIRAELHALLHELHLDGAAQAATGSQDAGGGAGGSSGTEDGGGSSGAGTEDGGAGSGYGGEDSGGGGAQAGVDSMSPSYLTISPSGAVGALFPGGVQIPEQVGGAVNPATSLTFVQGSTVREFIVGFSTASVTHELWVASSADGANGIDQAQLSLSTDELGAAGSAVVSAVAETSHGNTFARVLDDLGLSNFVQIATAKQTVFWSGAVNAAGTKRPTIGTTSGLGTWSVTRTGVGQYQLTLSLGVNGSYAIPTVQVNDGNAYPRVDYISNTTTTTVFNVFILQSTGGLPTLVDENWSFLAIGASA